MWQTQEGDRALVGLEGRLFADGLWDLIEDRNLSKWEDYELGIRIFDSLTYPQQIAVLHQVGTALLRSELPCPRLTAVLEGGVAAVFQHLRISVEIETDEPPPYRPTWRQRIARTCRECRVPDVPKVSSTDREAWNSCISSLEDRILWDADYDDGDNFMDSPPELDEAMKGMFGVSADYFTAIPPDPRPEEVPRLREELIALCRGICQQEGISREKPRLPKSKGKENP